AEAAARAVLRHVLPGLRAPNLTAHGPLGQGVAAQARFDPQPTALGDGLRSRPLALPAPPLAGVPLPEVTA
ncbi:exopolyphosphatase, partial [Streptomyces griseus]|nr:exopolyphosphatase [Streptomyces griseus]